MTDTVTPTTSPGYRVTFDSFSLAPITIPADSTDHEIAERIYDVLVDDGFNDIEVRVNRPAGTFTVYDGIDDVLGRGRVHEPEPDYWETLAEDLHRVAVRIAGLAGTDRKPEAEVRLDITVAYPGNTDLTAVELADTIADAFDAHRHMAAFAGGDRVYQVRAKIGTLQVHADTYLPAPLSELERLRAEVAELRAAQGGAR